MNTDQKRDGEVQLPRDPAEFADDANVVFIGRVRTEWASRKDCPKNLVQARERGKGAHIELDEYWRQGLLGLEKSSHAIVLYWMHEAQRNLIVQCPRHKNNPTGVFALRSPARPNPIALAIVEIKSIDIENGIVKIDAIDCLDGTPVVDIKPWIASIDAVGE